MSGYYRNKGTVAGWSGTTTSKKRAVENVQSGREESNSTKALFLLKSYPSGLTWKELSDLTGWHHGTASGVLSTLHMDDRIVRVSEVRNKCKVYMHKDHAKNVVAELRNKRSRVCPHCGNSI